MRTRLPGAVSGARCPAAPAGQGGDSAGHPSFWMTASEPTGAGGHEAIAEESIAPIALFLGTDDSAWLTGELLLATGGIR